MEYLKKNYNWFYWLVLFDGVVGISLNIVVLLNYSLGLFLSCLSFPLAIALIAACIVVIYKVLRHKKSKIQLIFPIVYLFYSVFGFIAGLLIGFLSYGDEELLSQLTVGVSIVGIIISVVETIFAILILIRNYKNRD